MAFLGPECSEIVVVVVVVFIVFPLSRKSGEVRQSCGNPRTTAVSDSAFSPPSLFSSIPSPTISVLSKSYILRTFSISRCRCFSGLRRAGDLGELFYILKQIKNLKKAIRDPTHFSLTRTALHFFNFQVANQPST
ncbi:hypothetical protein BT69DRAFT_580044 [Atractiella rhizophila]|nr:hypothetical protein BT69DRAFT_580044 [Atractiella rhizophila]